MYLNFLHRFCIGLSSKDWVAHSRTLICFLQRKGGVFRVTVMLDVQFRLREGCFWAKCHNPCPHLSSP